MDDLISRQVAINLIKEYERDSTAPLDYVKIIKEVPSADAVAVVRCKDCKYRILNEHSKQVC